jgi:hypothetical protein
MRMGNIVDLVRPETAFDLETVAVIASALEPAALQSCASPNFFYTASTPTDIQNALLMMFQQSVNTAHISQ